MSNLALKNAIIGAKLLKISDMPKFIALKMKF